MKFVCSKCGKIVGKDDVIIESTDEASITAQIKFYCSEKCKNKRWDE